MNKEEIQFNMKLGALVSGEILKDYTTLLGLEYGEKKDPNSKYLTNLCDKLNKTTTTLLKNLGRDVVNSGSEPVIQSEIQRNFNVIYDTLSLNFENQNRVQQLVNKLKREELNKLETN